MRTAVNRAFVIAGCWVLGISAPAQAQFVSGKVLDADTETPLANVSIELLSAAGQRLAATLSDSAGAFRIQAPLPGEFTVRAERIGMRTVTAPLSVQVGERVEVTLRMAALALPIEPLTVDARQAVNIGSLAGYYARAERVQRTGIGRVITRDRIESRPVGAVSDILREVPGITVTSTPYGSGAVSFSGGARAGCTPQVYVDGVLANRAGPALVNELVQAVDLEGIEIYRGLATMGEYYDRTGCGVILLWTRRGTEGGRPFTWSRLLALGALLGLILLISQ